MARNGFRLTGGIERYKTEYPQPDSKPQERSYIAWYRGLLLNIGQSLAETKLDSMEILDGLFNEIYIPLSLKYGIIPKVIDFCLMCHINPDSLSNIKPNTVGYDIYQKWLNICKQYVIANLTDEIGSNINLIFIAKAVYGMSDSPDRTASKPKITARTREQVLMELSTKDNTQIE